MIKSNSEKNSEFLFLCFDDVNPNGGGKRGGEERDLTQIETINRRVGLPLSKWSTTGVLRKGHGLDFFSVLKAYWVSR